MEDIKLIAVIDTETTGLTLHPTAPLEKQPKIIEFGAALLRSDDGTVVDTINILIHPGEEITEEITKITGITNDMLAGQPSFELVLPRIVAFMARASVVIAHNLPFDKSLVKYDCKRLGVIFPEDIPGMTFPDGAPNPGKVFPWPEQEACTVGLYRDVWGRNPKMLELYEWSLRKPLAQTHRALDDVLALVEIVQAEKIHEIF